MNLKDTCNQILLQLIELVDQLSDREFTSPSRALGSSTIGQHLRHTLEFFICFEAGAAAGKVNYDKRNHDKKIETDRRIAADTIQRIMRFVERVNTSSSFELEVSYDFDGAHTTEIHTNAARELVYNIEHAVHHMAIMKIGIREVAPHIQLSPDFGVAVSTLRHQRETMPVSAS